MFKDFTAYIAEINPGYKEATTEGKFKALQEWLASYIVYDRFSESKDIVKWENPEQLNEFINICIAKLLCQIF